MKGSQSWTGSLQKLVSPARMWCEFLFCQRFESQLMVAWHFLAHTPVATIDHLDPPRQPVCWRGRWLQKLQLRSNPRRLYSCCCQTFHQRAVSSWSVQLQRSLHPYEYPLESHVHCHELRYCRRYAGLPRSCRSSLLALHRYCYRQFRIPDGVVQRSPHHRYTFQAACVLLRAPWAR